MLLCGTGFSLANSLTLRSDGSSSDTSSAMIATTTSNSTSVNALCLFTAWSPHQSLSNEMKPDYGSIFYSHSVVKAYSDAVTGTQYAHLLPGRLRLGLPGSHHLELLIQGGGGIVAGSVAVRSVSTAR